MAWWQPHMFGCVLLTCQLRGRQVGVWASVWKILFLFKIKSNPTFVFPLWFNKKLWRVNNAYYGEEVNCVKEYKIQSNLSCFQCVLCKKNNVLWGHIEISFVKESFGHFFKETKITYSYHIHMRMPMLQYSMTG